MRERIYFAKVRPDAIIPSKKHTEAGYDVYANFEEIRMVIQPHETKMIPSGIASSFSHDYYFQLFGRGSTGTKGIAQMSGVIDSSFRGEWFVPLVNTTDKILYISKTVDKFQEDELTMWYPYSKAICQAIFLPVPKTTIEEISYDLLKTFKSDRGTGSLGSSGK